MAAAGGLGPDLPHALQVLIKFHNVLVTLVGCFLESIKFLM